MYQSVQLYTSSTLQYLITSILQYSFCAPFPFMVNVLLLYSSIALTQSFKSFDDLSLVLLSSVPSKLSQVFGDQMCLYKLYPSQAISYVVIWRMCHIIVAFLLLNLSCEKLPICPFSFLYGPYQCFNMQGCNFCCYTLKNHQKHI